MEIEISELCTHIRMGCICRWYNLAAFSCSCRCSWRWRHGYLIFCSACLLKVRGGGAGWHRVQYSVPNTSHQTYNLTATPRPLSFWYLSYTWEPIIFIRKREGGQICWLDENLLNTKIWENKFRGEGGGGKTPETPKCHFNS